MTLVVVHVHTCTHTYAHKYYCTTYVPGRIPMWSHMKDFSLLLLHYHIFAVALFDCEPAKRLQIETWFDWFSCVDQRGKLKRLKKKKKKSQVNSLVASSGKDRASVSHTHPGPREGAVGFVTGVGPPQINSAACNWTTLAASRAGLMCRWCWRWD